MSTKTESLALAELAYDLNDAKPERGVYCNIGPGHVSVTVFHENGQIDWQKNLYDWSHDEAYLPKLRMLRHRLEEMYREALAQREQVAA